MSAVFEGIFSMISFETALSAVEKFSSKFQLEIEQINECLSAFSIYAYPE